MFNQAILCFSTPLLVALVLAYLLEWPVQKLAHLKMSRTLATVLVMLLFIGLCLMIMVFLLPTLWTQTSNLVKELPNMLDHVRSYVLELPDRYPSLVQPEQVKTLVDESQKTLITWAQTALGFTVGSLGNVVAILIYLILVPLLMFTANRRLMGDLVNRHWVTAIGMLVAAVIILLNGYVLVGELM